jgi:hypothetical protein
MRLTDRLWFSSTSFNWQELDIFWRPMDLRSLGELDWPTVVQFHLIQLTGTGYIVAAHGFAITWGAWLTDCGSVTAQFIDRNWTDSGSSFFCDPLGWLSNLRWVNREKLYLNKLTYLRPVDLFAITEWDWLTDCGSVPPHFIDRNWIYSGGPWICDHLGSLTDRLWFSHSSIYWQELDRLWQLILLRSFGVVV